MYKNNLLTNSVRLALVSGAMTAAFAAPAVFADEEDSVERIEVTGSRIKRTDMETSSPIHVMDAEQIKMSGFTNVEDILNQLPQLEAGENSFLSNGATGTSSLDLRGLGSNRTLVLINGRRMQAGSITSQDADINQIPAALIKRVEVMTGGAAAVYGADAVAGVVNFIMDKSFDGISINVGASGYQHDNDNGYIQGLMDEKGYDYPSGNTDIDGKTYNIDLTIGSEFSDGKGHAVAYAVWRRNDELLQGSRDYASCVLNAKQSECAGSSTTPLAHFDIYPVVNGNVDYDQNYWGYTDPNGNGFKPDDGYRYNYAPINHFMRPNERISFGSFINYEINDHARPYVELSFMQNRTAGQIAESGTFYDEEILMDYNNPLMTDLQKQQLQAEFNQTDADQFVAYIGKRNVEGGARANNLEHNSYRILTGIEGDINDNWTYDVSFNYSATSSSSVYINDLLSPKIAPRVGAVDTECVEEDGCLYYNVFEPDGVTAEQAEQLAGVGTQTGLVTQTIYNGYVTGDIGVTVPSASDAIAMVFGFERREQNYERISDTIYSEGQLLGQGGPNPSLFGEIDVNEVFTEVQIPVLDNLAFDLGARYSDYSTTGGDWTYKVGADYTLADNYMFRASFNRAVRAPNVNELFGSPVIQLWDGSDGCTTDDKGNTKYTAAQCANTGVTASQYGNLNPNDAGQYNEFSGGSPDLEPEEAETLTLGLVANPIDNLSFSIDYFNIEMENVIDYIGAERILDICAVSGESDFCSNVNRSPSGSLWLGKSGYVTNIIGNVSSRTWEGVDASASYLFELASGDLSFDLIGSYAMKKEIRPVVGKDEFNYDCAGTVNSDCFASPKWRHTLTAKYSADDWVLAAKWRYYGEIDYDGTADERLVEQGGIDAYNYFDLNGSYIFTDYMSVTAGVNNIFDKEPPMVGNTIASNANTVAGFYDTLGRFMHVSLNFKF
ncbi:TonB-dependent receptor [Shewanella piezotolerans WP3]|uniref:TonB-dependent receptor n=1 Tax=Shewanella piezotolerans (strain WP3 / JCM 13877) TaxID=225849 RepID=B8CQ30_SHEPW|nr:TonB-dependent receptor [Shewanella piezotolerans]ACJ29893.1 TonB-dependent receptor [Shewanella piezotolerans WP3]